LKLQSECLRQLRTLCDDFTDQILLNACEIPFISFLGRVALRQKGLLTTQLRRNWNNSRTEIFASFLIPIEAKTLSSFSVTLSLEKFDRYARPAAVFELPYTSCFVHKVTCWCCSKAMPSSSFTLSRTSGFVLEGIRV
jgi:hypothetical protein